MHLLVAQRAERPVARAGDAVVRFGLVLEHHQRDDVAVRREVGARCRTRRQGPLSVEPRLGDRPRVVAVAVLQCVLPMCRVGRSCRSTYHPPQRSSSGLSCVVTNVPAGRIGCAVGVGEDRAHEQPGHVARHRVAVTLEAVVGLRGRIGGVRGRGFGLVRGCRRPCRAFGSTLAISSTSPPGT